jgi:hypothetical protein
LRASLGAHQGACQRTPVRSAGRRGAWACIDGVTGAIVNAAQRSGRRLRCVGQWRNANDAVQVLAPADIDARFGPLHEPHWRSPCLDSAKGVHIIVVIVVEVRALVVLRPILLLLGARDELPDAEGRPGQHGAVLGGTRRGEGERRTGQGRST